MLDAEEVHGFSDADPSDEDEQTAEPRPVFVVEVTNAKKTTAAFLCVLSPEAQLQVLKVCSPPPPALSIRPHYLHYTLYTKIRMTKKPLLLSQFCF